MAEDDLETDTEAQPAAGSGLASQAIDKDPRIGRCGFCKLEGVSEDMEFVSRRYEVTIGRRSKTTPLDVVLGGRLCFNQDCRELPTKKD